MSRSNRLLGYGFHTAKKNRVPFAMPPFGGQARFLSTNLNNLNQIKEENEQLKRELKQLKLQYEEEMSDMNKQMEELKKKKPAGKLFGLVSQYGLPFVVWWTTLYGISGVGIYFAIENGLIGGGDAIEWIRASGLDQYIDVEKLNPKYGNVAAAVVINEVLEVVRFPIAAATTATVARRWKSFASKKDKIKQ